jgi:mono/diheme cytochrome c family protein
MTRREKVMWTFRRVLILPFVIWPLGALNAETLMERGDYLVNSIVACGNCHTQQTPAGPNLKLRLAGTFLIEEPMFKAFSPNITPDKQTGIGTWSKAQLIRAIREGKRPDASLLGPPMPFGLYRSLSDRDAEAIATYIMAQPAIRNEVQKSTYNFPLPKSYGPPVTSVRETPRQDQLAYGAYLIGPLGHCIECHTPMVKGVPQFETRLGAGGFEFHGPWGISVSANITSHKQDGIAGYSDSEIDSIIRTGKRANGQRLLPPMGFYYYKNISKQDMAAMIAYLRSLPPKPSK